MTGKAGDVPLRISFSGMRTYVNKNVYLFGGTKFWIYI